MDEDGERLALHLRRLRLRHFEVLLAVARHGSLTASAPALDSTQPAVSQWLAEIEAAVGAQLFVRGRQLKPTPQLAPVLRHARRVVADSRRLAHELAAVARDAGFEVRRVEVRGVKNLNELKVYERALAERERAMPLVDIDALRDELLQLSWVQDARVSRQLPDTLVIDIVERKPAAVLKKAGKLVLIDAEGTELETVSAARAKGKLVVGGPGAGKQVVALGALLDAAPAIKGQVREAEWVGNRRWNLTFRTGQVLALPEGGRQSAGALMKFAQIDGRNRLLGGKVAAFDMRAPDRIYLRVPGRTDEIEQAAVVATSTKAKAEAEGDKPETAKPAAKAEEKN